MVDNQNFQLEGGPAIIIQHSFFYGQRKLPVRGFKVSEVAHSNFGRVDNPTVIVSYLAPRKRLWDKIYLYQIERQPDFIFEGGCSACGCTEYVTIERDGNVLYDSRKDVPCDMELWEEMRGKYMAVEVSG